MNKRGQTLILFVLLLPIIASFLAFFIDLSLVKYEKNKIDSIILSNLEIIVDNEITDLERIQSIYRENGLKVADVYLSGDEIVVEVEKEIKSIFGKILNFDLYEIDCNYKGNYQNKEVEKINEKN